MNANPKIKVKPTLFTTIIEIINYFLLILFWVITSLVYKHLPNKIPTHYNGFGEVDAYGDKTTIFLLPLIATVLFLIVSISAKNPHTFKYSITITEQNAEGQYKNAMRFMQLIKLFMLLVFIFIDYKTIQIAFNESENLGVWFLPALIFIVLTIICYSIIQSKKK